MLYIVTLKNGQLNEIWMLSGDQLLEDLEWEHFNKVH